MTAPAVRQATPSQLEADGRTKFVIEAGTKVCDFVTSSRHVDVIEGPLGSGKTKALCARIMRHAQEQAVSPIDGLRHTRFAIVRNTMPDLKRTTVRSWLELFPEHVYGRFNWAGGNMHHRLRFADVDLEVDFLALDKPEDVRKLRSTEYTGVAFNELAFIDKEIFDEADSRLRFPPPEHGGPTWRGVIADSNAPDEDHWLAVMTGQVEMPPGLTDDEIAAYTWPDSWGLHLQPPALLERLDQHGNVTGYAVNPEAENIKNLPADYYQRQIIGKKKAWIDSRLMVRVVLVTEGSPVYPMFRREVHVSREILRPNPHYDVDVGLDFGRSPAALFCQAINNRVLMQYELIGANEGAAVFAPKVRRFIAKCYPDHAIERFRFWGDPKGQDKGQADERTAYDIFKANGMPVRPPPGLKMNMISTRVDTVSSLLGEMTDGKPRHVSSPLCRTYNVGMAGRYFNERDELGELRPCKKRHSHICEAGQYLCMGLGEARHMVGLKPIGNVHPVQTHNRRRTMRRLSA